jgi:hypothetical protein
MSKVIRLYVGVGFGAVTFARTVLVPLFGGATVTDSQGFWTDDTGKVHDEPGHVITLAIESNEDLALAVKSAQNHAALTGEQSVMIEDYDGSITFKDATSWPV